MLPWKPSLPFQGQHLAMKKTECVAACTQGTATQDQTDYYCFVAHVRQGAPVSDDADCCVMYTMLV